MSYAEYISQLINCTPTELKGPEKSSFLRLMELSNKNEGIHSYLWFKKQAPFSSEDEELLSTLVDGNLVEVIHGGRFRRGGRNYALTTCGLFYILNENQVSLAFYSRDTVAILYCNCCYFNTWKRTPSKIRVHNLNS
jgi:hypothetical protein